MTTRPRIADIADRLDVSKATVSKALRGRGRVSEATRTLVLDTARDLGYVADRAARSLSTRETRTIGVVIPAIANSFFAEVVEGMSEAAAAAGYDIVLAVSFERVDREREAVEALLALRVDGLLVSAAVEAEAERLATRARGLGVPFVFFDRRPESGPGSGGRAVSSVLVDNEGGSYTATRHLLEAGATRVAHLAGPAALSIGRLRRAGYERALAEAGRPVDPDFIAGDGFGEAEGARSMRAVLDRTAGAPPDAVFAVTYPAGVGALDALAEAGLDVPVASFGGHPMNRRLARPLAVVEQPTAELGRRAVSVLLEEIADPSLAGRAATLDVAWNPAP